LDAERFVLFHDGRILQTVEKKPIEVLSLLVQNANHLVSHDEIIAKVWPDNAYGVTPARINQYVSRLRKNLDKYEPASPYIENVRGRGYIFVGEVTLCANERGPSINPANPDAVSPAEARRRPIYVYLAAAGLVAALIATLSWAFSSQCP